MIAVDVTPDHMAKGQKNAFHNPIALAIQEQHGAHAVVTPNRAHMIKPEERIAALPPECVTFLTDFMRDRRVQPFRFYL